MTWSEQQRAIEGLLERLKAEIDAHPGGARAATRRLEMTALELIKRHWDGSAILEERRGEQIPPPVGKTYRYEGKTQREWVSS